MICNAYDHICDLQVKWERDQLSPAAIAWSNQSSWKEIQENMFWASKGLALVAVVMSIQMPYQMEVMGCEAHNDDDGHNDDNGDNDVE